MAVKSTEKNKVRLFKHVQHIIAFSREKIDRGEDYPPNGEEAESVVGSWQSYLEEMTDQYNELLDDVSKVFPKNSQHIMRYIKRFDELPKSFSELHNRSIKLAMNLEDFGEIPIEFTSKMILTRAERRVCESLLNIKESQFETNEAYNQCKKASKPLVDECLSKLHMMGNIKRLRKGLYEILLRELPI